MALSGFNEVMPYRRETVTCLDLKERFDRQA
jgi:hypothetical protein